MVWLKSDCTSWNMLPERCAHLADDDAAAFADAGLAHAGRHDVGDRAQEIRVRPVEGSHLVWCGPPKTP